MWRWITFFEILFAWIVTSSNPIFGANAPLQILYLGDSLSLGAFGQTFDQEMRSSGYDVHTVVAGGASPYYWLKSYQSLPCTIGFWEKTTESERRLGYVRAVPKLEDLMQAKKPDIVVVQTGINLYATLRSKRKPKEENVHEVRSLIEQMCESIANTGAISYWILPPHSHEERYPLELQEELTSLMEGAVQQYHGMVFESRNVTHFNDPYPATDGIHYGPTEAREWAEKVSMAFLEIAKEPSKWESRGSHATVERASLPRSRTQAPLPTASSVEARDSGGDASWTNLPDEVLLRIRLEEKSEIHNPSELDYANALGLYEYTVVEDLRGNFPYPRIRVAQGIVFRRQLTSATKAEIGSERELTLVPLSKYKNLEHWQMVDDLRPNFEIPVYTPKLE